MLISHDRALLEAVGSRTIVVEDRKLGDLARQDIQNLRCGLNALARCFG